MRCWMYLFIFVYCLSWRKQLGTKFDPSNIN